MESTPNTFNDRLTSVNVALQISQETGLVIGFKNNQYSIENPFFNEKIIIETFSKMLISQKARIFSESLKNDLTEAIQNVFELYNLKFEVEND